MINTHHSLNLLILVSFSIFIIALGSSCDNDSSAQGNDVAFTETYSGSFVTASTLTDSNNDGKPANLGEFEGDSTFGSVVIQSLNEYEAADSNVDCNAGEIEFTLVRGNFVKRFENGELIYGTWDSGTSCFDPSTNNDVTFQIGTFSGGTGQFENATGPIRIDFTATFLVLPSQDGFDFGGASGTGEGTITLN